MYTHISLHKTLYKCICNLKIAQVQVYRKRKRERKVEKEKKEKFRRDKET